jgi:hypothetical protein
MFFIEDKNFLNQNQINSIQNILKGGDVPFYMSLEAAKPGDGGINFVHHIIHRDSPEKINSPLYDLFVSILNTFCEKNNIKYSKIHRCAINITLNNGVLDRCPIHEDHFFPHNQLLIYLNESDGDTIILNKLGEELQVSKPELYKGIAFNNLPHYHYFPKKGIRVVSVITFS